MPQPLFLLLLDCSFSQVFTHSTQREVLRACLVFILEISVLVLNWVKQESYASHVGHRTVVFLKDILQSEQVGIKVR